MVSFSLLPLAILPCVLTLHSFQLINILGKQKPHTQDKLTVCMREALESHDAALKRAKSLVDQYVLMSPHRQKALDLLAFGISMCGGVIKDEYMEYSKALIHSGLGLAVPKHTHAFSIASEQFVRHAITQNIGVNSVNSTADEDPVLRVSEWCVCVCRIASVSVGTGISTNNLCWHKQSVSAQIIYVGKIKLCWHK